MDGSDEIGPRHNVLGPKKLRGTSRQQCPEDEFDKFLGDGGTVLRLSRLAERYRKRLTAQADELANQSHQALGIGDRQSESGCRSAVSSLAGHGDGHGLFGLNEVIHAHSILGNGQLDALDGS